MAVLAVVAVAVAGGVIWLTRGGDGDTPSDVSAPDLAAASTPRAGGALVPLDESIRLFGGGVGSPEILSDRAEIVVSGRASGVDELSLAVLTIEATSGGSAVDVTVEPCTGTQATSPSLRLAPSSTATRQLLVPIGSDGAVCLQPSAAVEVTVDLDAFVDAASVQPFPAPVRIADTTASGETADDRLAAIGVRPDTSTLRVPVTRRFDGLAEAGAIAVSVAAVDPLEAGEVEVFAPEAGATDASLTASYDLDESARSVAIVPIGASGELCVSNTGRTDVVVELLGLVPSTVTAPLDGTGTCPGQTVFPDHRIVALYGTQRSERLGVLGEQTPADAVERLEEVAAPWRAGDRPVLPAFELIATLATGTPEDRGVYNLRSSPEFVQEYLDVARRHGFHLILDLQTGQSDFLTEATYYDEFLRQPDVHLALDPEWRTAPPARPRGGFIGTVDAPEVNEVVEYLAQIVEEEDLPEKLLVLHQFEPNMITNRDQIVELPGVAINLHMDGFGPRPEKVNSYEVVKADPPWNMGLKLFYDEDTDLLDAPTVLNGELFDPVPDLITYQ